MHLDAKLIALVAGLFLAARAQASEVTHIASSLPVSPGGTTFLSVPYFDSSLGVLRAVRISAVSTVSGTWQVENVSTSPNTFGGFSSGTYVGASVTATLPAGTMPTMNPAYSYDPALTLPAFDGTIDYSGASGTSIGFADWPGDGEQVVDVTSELVIASYVGVGLFPINIGPVVAVGPSMPAGFQTNVSRTVRTTATVRYTYDPYPARICRAGALSGCPCNNSSPVWNGCASSVNPNGAGLDVVGNASITNDTLVLSGSGMTDGSSLYFGGTAFGYSQTAFGDGLLCVAGTIKRLGVKFNVSGASQFPASGDPTISAMSGITSPGMRTYQVWYRDSAVSFCTSARHNHTNGVAVQWTL